MNVGGGALGGTVEGRVYLFFYSYIYFNSQSPESLQMPESNYGWHIHTTIPFELPASCLSLTLIVFTDTADLKEIFRGETLSTFKLEIHSKTEVTFAIPFFYLFGSFNMCERERLSPKTTIPKLQRHQDSALSRSNDESSVTHSAALKNVLLFFLNPQMSFISLWCQRIRTLRDVALSKYSKIYLSVAQRNLSPDNFTDQTLTPSILSCLDWTFQN